MATLGHSTGLLLIDGAVVADNAIYSFHATDGEYLGWGQAGAYPTLDINPPQGAVHTVYVPELTDEAKVTINAIANEHVARYGECRIYTYPENTGLAAWVSGGSPAPEDTDDQTAAAIEQAQANAEDAPAVTTTVEQPDADPNAVAIAEGSPLPAADAPSSPMEVHDLPQPDGWATEGEPDERPTDPRDGPGSTASIDGAATDG